MILLTAKAPAATDRLVNEVVAVLSKPFDPMRLPGQIANALGWAA